MQKGSAEIGLSFDMPDSLTVKQLDDYQIAMQQAIKSLNGTPLTVARLNAVAYGVATGQGLIANWQCERMPAKPDNIDQADARIINYAGTLVREYIEEIANVPFG